MANKIHKSGGYNGPVLNTNIDYVITNDDSYQTVNVDTSGANRNITIPVAAVANTGKRVTIKKVTPDANIVFILGAIDGIIDPTSGVGDCLFDMGESITIESSGTAWGGVNSFKHEESGITTEFNSPTIPNRYIEEYGQALNATASPQYYRLWLKIGTTYGGTGIANFNAPDSRGRSSIGKDNMGGVAANRITAAGSGITGTTLGASGGTETHTLSAAQSGTTAHPHGNTFSISGGVTNFIGSFSGSNQLYDGDPGPGASLPQASDGTTTMGSDSISVTGNHGHANSFAITGSVTNAVAAAAANAHQNTQPSIIKIRAIKL